jgi:cyclophilin family peptidyl-prolyl cis-trans isomerase
MVLSTRALILLVLTVLSVSAAGGDKLIVKCGTTKGDFRIELHPEWSPNGVIRFVDLVKDGFFDGSAFFRAVNNFLVQFGIPTDPAKAQAWRERGEIKDDRRQPNLGEGVGGPGGKFPKGGVSFAGSGPNSRTTQLFITYAPGVVGE